MICIWGGWTLFQELLRTLKTIADKYHVSISNVATRWVLDFPYVAAVIVGVRMGVSEHAAENLASFGWHLDHDDQEAIEKVLQKSSRMGTFESMGDCGGEYR
jgi:aryl-alcohol dehydrogenase-like predicted oxidoreductase